MVTARPETKAVHAESARIRPALIGSCRRNSATYFVAVKPKPSPAKTPKVLAVLWIIPSAPNSCQENARKL